MRFHLILLSVLAFLVAACGGNGDTGTTTTTAGDDALCTVPADTSEIIGEAGTFTVTQLEWDAELLTIPARARGRYDNDKGRKDIADRVLLNKALFAEAKTRGLLDDPKVRMSARLAAEKAFVGALLAQVESEAASDEAVLAYYDENKDRYSRPEVRARHILIKDEALARDVHGQITGGGDFAALAREHSEDRGSKGKGSSKPKKKRNLSRGLGGKFTSNCPFPPQADLHQVDRAVVQLMVTVNASGRVQSARVVSDPGYGFGSQARRCMMARSFPPALDSSGRPVTMTAPMNVQFRRR